MVASNRPETEFIPEVVDAVYKRLNREQIRIPKNVVGIDAWHKKIFDSGLKDSKEDFFVIYGMPGSGKSTLARYIVDMYRQNFDSYSIVENIGARCKNQHEPYEMVKLQKQLFSDISQRKDIIVPNVFQGAVQIEVLLKTTKALILLDDIVNVGQLDKLLGLGNMNKESKIIITTTNISICNWLISNPKSYKMHQMPSLVNNEELELFSLHAFHSKTPKDGYEEFAQQVVDYCKGYPLALEVLGSSFSQKTSIAVWESEVRSLGKEIHRDIYVVLKRSYDSLSSLEQELFLHIACFFVGEHMDYVVNILEHDYNAKSKIQNLTERCFLYVTPEKKLMMHGLLQEMGRNLVDRESRILAERSRVWRNKDSYDILRRKKSSTTIEGLALDIEMLLKEGRRKEELHEGLHDM